MQAQADQFHLTAVRDRRDDVFVDLLQHELKDRAQTTLVRCFHVRLLLSLCGFRDGAGFVSTRAVVLAVPLVLVFADRRLLVVEARPANAQGDCQDLFSASRRSLSLLTNAI